MAARLKQVLSTSVSNSPQVLDVTMLVDEHAQQLYSELDSIIDPGNTCEQCCYQALSRVAVHVHQQALLHPRSESHWSAGAKA